MPKRADLKSILILGAGPIVIGQACEFDYSGTQACAALKEEGYRIILVNSNPATIMTDPAMADATYIEPLEVNSLEKIIEKERPCAILPTMGGQTALNCALDLAKAGILEKHKVILIGANKEAIDKAEDRDLFRKAMLKIGLEVPKAAIAHSLEEALQQLDFIGFPAIIRPSFTLGGSGGGIAYNREEFIEICTRGLELSPTNELLIDESLIGWKEFELEVVRDTQDNVIIVCSIENLDPMGVHTGDSITVSPIQTLTDKEFQIMRDAAIAVVREIGVDTGGANVQFGLNPQNGRMVVIEMNPRVSRSSALASKATGFPIAKVAAKLAVGYSLSELKNAITEHKTPCSFEPTLDYVVTKIPRFNFEKFPQTDNKLTTQMKSVGEVMAIGRTFQESLQKALNGLEIGIDGFVQQCKNYDEDCLDEIQSELKLPSEKRLFFVADAFRMGKSLAWVAGHSHIDSWFLAEIEDIIHHENALKNKDINSFTFAELFHLKKMGFSDSRLAYLLKVPEKLIRDTRFKLNVLPVYKRVDSCAAEFSTSTAYLYSTYADECEAAPTNDNKIMVLGGGPNRIGQGIEFDYCCVHASLAARESGYKTIMVNCNPETVSTDYDISDCLYFEPLTLEHVLSIVEIEKPEGVIIQYGGQTPLKLAKRLEEAGVPILGTKPEAIDIAEDRDRFRQLIEKLNLKQPINCTAITVEESLDKAQKIGYPLMVRPSYVLGGRAMEVVYNDKELLHYMQHAVSVSDKSPVLLDSFLDDAIEVDVDAICDGERVFVAGIMEHIEQAGVHSGDSACSLPAFTLNDNILANIKQQVTSIALALNVVGVINTQFAIKNNEVYILEVNPRASRTVPFVSKATGMPMAKIATRCMLGETLNQQKIPDKLQLSHHAVKVSVFPFDKFTNVDPILGPEMKSTGEVMGIGKSFTEAYAKAQKAANIHLKRKGCVFMSLRDNDKAQAIKLGEQFAQLGFKIVATKGTAYALTKAGIPCSPVNKVREGRPHIVDMIKNDEIDFIVNTTEGKKAIKDSYDIRRSALQHKVNSTTTMQGALAAVKVLSEEDFNNVNCLQELLRRTS